MSNDMTKLKDYHISELAYIVRSDWRVVDSTARPYLDAMSQLDTIKDKYGCDSGSGIVAYFLSNARSWKGPIAKAVKAELNRRLKLVK